MPAKNEQLAAIFRALGDPSRLAIFETIREACADGTAHTEEEVETGVTEIASHFDLSLSTVSHHIKELRAAGLVRCERRGQRILCSVDPDALAVIDQFVGTEQ